LTQCDSRVFRYRTYLLWPPCVADADIIFCPVVSIFLFSSPNLSHRRLDVYHTSTHGVPCGPSANLECRSEMCCARLAGNTGRKKSPSRHGTSLLGYIFATKACIDNRKKNLLNSNVSPICSPNMVNFGLLAAEICWRVWGTLQISTGFASWQRYCTAL